MIFFVITYVNDASILVKHDVTVVPVFDLQEEAHETVGRHALYEVAPGHLVLCAVLVAVQAEEVLVQARVRSSAQLVTGLGIRDALDHAALTGTKTGRFIRHNIISKRHRQK